MNLRSHLLAGQVIPAQPLALDHSRRFSEKHQRALTRYYVAAGSGGLAVGVHSTQFEIRQPQHGLFRPVLELAAETVRTELPRMDHIRSATPQAGTPLRGVRDQPEEPPLTSHETPPEASSSESDVSKPSTTPRDFALIAGICGPTPQALAEAELARSLGYHAGLVSMAALANESEDAILAHVATVADAIPVVGFYLQPAVGGRVFTYAFWRRFAEIPHVVAIKIAPFNRYQTLDVIRAVVAAGRDDLALYTGNDDTIVADLLTPFTFPHHNRPVTRRIVGGLLGHWGVWTRAAVELFRHAQTAARAPQLDATWLGRAAAVTDMNAAVFDAANRFHGCIPGILEVLRRQGLVETNHCLNPNEVLSPGQSEELDRVTAAYPDFTDDTFVAEHRDRWLR